MDWIVCNLVMEWIVCNLPFSESGKAESEFVFPPSPDLSADEKAKFGLTWDEVEAQMEGPMADLRDEWQQACNDAWANPGNVSSDTMDRRLRKAFKAKGPRHVAFLELRKLRGRMTRWSAQHPATIAHREACTAVRYEGTFKGLGLVRPGVQIEMANGKRYLIGDVNRLRGVCDDCTEFDTTDIVVRYRVLVPESILEG
jgi:hypothetical protein